MARPMVITKQLVAASANNIAQSQTVGAGGGALTLNGTTVTGGVATLDTQRRIGITSAGNDSGITFTVKGTMDSGQAISETVTGANIGVASTLQDFATVTSVAASGATAAAVTVGTTAVGSTPWLVPDTHIVPFDVRADMELLSGAATASVEVTDDTPLPVLQIYQAGQAFTIPVPEPYAWAGLSAIVLALNTPSSGDINSPVAAFRLTINSGTGKVQMTARQAGIRVS